VAQEWHWAAGTARRGHRFDHKTFKQAPLTMLTSTSPDHDPRSLKILAKSFYRELRGRGYDEREVVALVGELLGLVSTEVRERREGAVACAPPAE
jgi:hypothetical protein